MQKEKTLIGLGIVLILIVFGVVTRFLPHAPNFTPLVAIALFSACYLPKKWGLVVPLVAMFVADLFIGFYDWPVMAAVYSSFVLIGVIGWLIKKNKKWFTIGIGAIGGALLFFFITNFAVWAFTPWYAKTLTGLIQSFTLALPFFKSTLFSSILYSASLFGAYELASRYLKLFYENRRLAKTESF